MCYNCGCNNPHDDMGSADNITSESLKKLADKEGKSLTDLQKEFLTELQTGKVSSRFETVLEKAAKAWGQSLDEAKKNTLNLLKDQLKA